MDFTDQDLRVLKALLASEKSKVLEHTSRVDILEKIIEGMEAAPVPLLIDRVFEIMSCLPERTLNSVAIQIHREKLIKGSKHVVYDKILSLFESGIEKNGKRVQVCNMTDSTGSPVKHLCRRP